MLIRWDMYVMKLLDGFVSQIDRISKEEATLGMQDHTHSF